MNASTDSPMKACAVALAVSLAGSACAGPISDFNLMVLGNLTSTSEVEGRTFVGGNLGGPSSTYATRLNPNDHLSIDTLIVGGNINAAAINLNAGNLRRGGSRNGNLNLNGGGVEIVDGSVVGFIGQYQATIANISAHLASLTPNSSVSLPGQQPAAATFNAAPAGPNNLAVFSINAADLFSNSLVQQIELNANSASSIIINVFGSNVVFNSGNFVGAWNDLGVRATTLWNFVDATSIDLQRQFSGAILAPNASLMNNTEINGSVFIGGSFTQNGEVHLPGYEGYIPSPGSLALLAAGAIVATRRRRA